ncbi:MAG: hypothetical protein RLZZ171_1635, partial [Cyanobacteriota bacterium]
MQAYKLTGKIDRSGKLIITEPTNLNPGDVEVIILQSATTENKFNDKSLETQNQLFRQVKSIENLVDIQQPSIVKDIKMLAGDYWQDDSSEDFLTFLKEQRQHEN